MLQVKRVVLISLMLVSGILAPAYSQEAGTDRAQRIELGETIQGRLDDQNTSDLYLIDVRTMTNLDFSVSSGAFHTILQLYSSEMELLVRDPFGGGGSDPPFDGIWIPAGSYYFEVKREKENSEGTYELTVQELNRVKQIELGDTIRGRLDGQNPMDLYSLEVRTETSLNISLMRRSGDLDPRIRLLNSDMQLLEWDDDGGEGRNSLIDDRWVAAGTYYIEVLRYTNISVGVYTSGDYELVVQAQPPSQEAGADMWQRIELGDTIRGRLDDQNNRDLYSIEVGIGTSLKISLMRRSDDLDPILRLYSSNMVLLETDDDGGEGRNSLIEDRLVPAGTYYIEVNRFNDGTSGSYSLTVLGEVEGPQRIELGETIQGRLDDQNNRDLYSIEVRTETSLDLSVMRRSGNLDPLLRLYSSNIELLEWDDDGGEGVNSLIEDRRVPAGTYYIEVNRYDDGTSGSYSLVVFDRIADTDIEESDFDISLDLENLDSNLPDSFLDDDPWFGLQSNLQNSLGKGISIEDLTCTATDTWFIVALKPNDMGEYVSLSLRIVAEGDAVLKHVLPVTDKSLADYRNEAIMEITMYVFESPLHLIPFATFLVESGETLVNVFTIIEEYKADLAREQAKKIGVIQLTTNQRAAESSLLFHIVHDIGYVSTQATYFVDDEDVGAWLVDNLISETNITVPLVPITFPLEILCE